MDAIFQIKINKIINKNKQKKGMTDIIIAFFVCFTIVAYCFFWFNKSELHMECDKGEYH